MTPKPAASFPARNRPTISLVFDGECPVCFAYCRVLALRELDGDLELVDARSDHPAVSQLKSEGIDLNEGMVLKLGDQTYHGADAIHRLSLISSRSGWFNRLNFLIFRHRRLSHILYPVLKSGRQMLLGLLGRSKIVRLLRQQ